MFCQSLLKQFELHLICLKSVIWIKFEWLIDKEACEFTEARAEASGRQIITPCSKLSSWQ